MKRHHEPAQGPIVARAGWATDIPVNRIGPDPEQPRATFDEEAIDRLAESLRERGQLQPIRVRRSTERGRFTIVCGERRWRAAGRAGLSSLTCIVVDDRGDPLDRLEVQLVENLVREDLRPIEEARAYQALIAARGWSTHRLGRSLGISQSRVVRALALLDLPDAVRAEVESGTLAARTAYEVSKLPTAQAQTAFAAQVVAEGLSRTEAVAIVREARRPPCPTPAPALPIQAPVPPPPWSVSVGGATVTVAWDQPAEPGAVLSALEAALEHALQE